MIHRSTIAVIAKSLWSVVGIPPWTPFVRPFG